jgi:hypothetical protein
LKKREKEGRLSTAVEAMHLVNGVTNQYVATNIDPA